MDYCDTKKETFKNPLMKDWLIAASNGNKHAYDFLWRVWNWSQVFDDIIDGDYEEISKDELKRTRELQHGETIIKEFMSFIHMISFNPFYLNHKEQLYSLLIQMAHRAIIGDEWENSNNKLKKDSAHVIRCGDLDLFSHVSYLTGGWEHMRRMAEFRNYDNPNATSTAYDNGGKMADVRKFIRKDQ